MNTVDAVKLLDDFLKLRCVTGAEYAAWQTLKSIVLAQQTTNSQKDEIKPCTRLDDRAFVRQEGFWCIVRIDFTHLRYVGCNKAAI